jgi:hypothetical protein
MNLPAILGLSTLLASGLRGQDALLYKLEELAGPETLNFAGGVWAGPAAAAVMTSDTTGFAAGRFGLGALRGFTSSSAHSWIDSGWSPTFTGSFTVAFWILQRPAASPGASPSYLFSCSNGTGLFRMFTGGVAAKGLVCRGFESGGYGTELITTTDIVSGAATAWEHIALVVDAAALSAKFFVNGVVTTQLPLSAGAGVAPGVAPFRVGAFSMPTSYPGYYDIDEFRFALRAASDLEVGVWASRAIAADAPYGSGCYGGLLSGNGTPPSTGNAAYGLRVTGQPGGVYAMALGTSRTLLQGTYPLPIDLGIVMPSLSGCIWQSSGEAWVGGAIGTGPASFPLPVPSNPALDGATLFTQALINGIGGVQVTNGFAIAVGR